MISFEKSAGAVVFRKEGNKIKYLLLQYRNGHWDLPRGHIEQGETAEKTAQREIKEETGITELFFIPGFFGKGQFWYIAKGEERKERLRDKRGLVVFKKVYFFLAETKNSEVILSKEQKNYKWLRYEDAVRQATFKVPKKVLKKAHNFLQSQL